MHLTHLRLVNFRNHARTEIELGPRLNCFVGQNAQGKSSILEAVEVAATGRSHRAARDVEVMRFGEEWTRVRAAARRTDREVEIDVLWQRLEEPLTPSLPHKGRGHGIGLKELRINGVPARRGDLFGLVPVVVASPHDEQVVMGPPAYRRRLLDLLLAQLSPAYFFTLMRYMRAVAQRNRLLRDHTPDALDVWDEQVAALGAIITARRRAAIHRLQVAAEDAYADLSGGSEPLTVSYVRSLEGEEETAMFEAAREAMARRRQDEVARGATLCGPHRDDLAMRIDGRDLRAFASRGQQHTAMLALRLAERRLLLEEIGEEPVLLLDDTLQALDEDRQQRVLTLLDRAQACVTVTTAEALRRMPPETVVYRVSGGMVESTATPEIRYHEFPGGPGAATNAYST